MNAYAVAILAALLGEFALEVTAGVLELGALDPTLPPEFAGVYEAERYSRALDYARARTRFGLVVAGVNLLLFLGFWYVGGFAHLDRALGAFEFGPVATGLLFIATLVLAHGMANLPFRWWSTFVVEARFGFNTTTAATFWADLGKGALLATLLGGPLLAAVLWLFLRAGSTAWLWCWAVSTVFVVAVQFVAPTWIMPLFNRFTPLADGPLRDALLGYARTVAFPLEDVFVIDGSRRSTKGNAFFTGFGRHKRVALFDTLVERLAPAELLAVVAHEIGHYKRHHVVTGMALAVLHMGAVFFLLSFVLASPGLFAAFSLDGPSVHAGLVLFGLLLTPVEVVLSVFLHALSRRHEHEADAFAAATTGGEPLATGLMRLSADSLANLSPHPLVVALHHSHPPVLERVRTLRARAQA